MPTTVTAGGTHVGTRLFARGGGRSAGRRTKAGRGGETMAIGAVTIATAPVGARVGPVNAASLRRTLR